MSNAQEAQVTKQATNIQIRIDELQDWPKVQQQKLEIRTMLQSLEDVRRLQIGPVELARRLRPLLVPDEWVAMSVAQQEDFLEPFFDLPPEEREALYYRLLRAKDPTSPLLLDETEAKQQVLVLQQVLSEATHDVQRVKEVRSEAEQGLEQVRLAQAKLEQQQQLDRQMITILLTHIDRVNKETESRVRWEVVAAALVTGFFSCVAVALTVWSSRQTSRDQFRRDELDHQRRQDDRPGPRKSALFDADGEPIGRSR
ncbi:hypothetical protein RSO01_68160 [Reyranella soli]|uniref:Uncharacterized protein n=2 Tax=Reyranella soli TaxID=1230389 RepID=A0A512NL17_9HYPH|nr:hypothetical protein RSO01_68160 [Reyranella soli]